MYRLRAIVEPKPHPENIEVRLGLSYERFVKPKLPAKNVLIIIPCSVS